MRCPYCSITMVPAVTGGMRGRNLMFYNDAGGGNHTVEAGSCPACEGVFLMHSDMVISDGPERGTATSVDVNKYVLLPRVSSRPPAPTDVPEPYRGLYNEAGLILTDSPRASAMLSRRCLQHLLREEAHAPKFPNLYNEIEWTIGNAGLPSYVTESLHEPRIVGNMGAHPTKTEDGEYIEVVAGEADWMLDVLDTLFEFYFVAKARTAARKAALAERMGI